MKRIPIEGADSDGTRLIGGCPASALRRRGIFNDAPGTDTNSTITANTAASDGAGLYNGNGTLTVGGSTISGNKDNQNGGGVFNAGTVTFKYSTIAGSAANQGRGIFNVGTLSLTSTLVVGNRGPDRPQYLSLGVGPR